MTQSECATDLYNDPLLYDSSVMPPEERVLSVLDMVHQRPVPALERLKRYGLPASALYDWIMECSLNMHKYLADYRNRECHKPRDQWNIIAVVPARGGSKGVPRKALRVIAGKTLLQRAIEVCHQIKGVNRVIVNTDSPEIADHAKKFGAEAPFLRPLELAQDDSSLEEAVLFTRYWLLLMEDSLYDFLVVVSASTPGIDPQEINLSIDRLATHNTVSLQTVAPLPSCSLDFRHLNPDGTLRPFLDQPLPDASHLAVQCGAFSVHCHRPFYQVPPWFRQYLSESPYLPPAPIAHLLPSAQTIEVDEKWDLEACAMLLQEDCPVHMVDASHNPTLALSRPPVVEVGPDNLISLVFIPPLERSLEVEGEAAPDRVLAALNKARIRHIILWGEAAARRKTTRHDLPFIAVNSPAVLQDDPYNGGMAHAAMAALLRRKLSLGTEIRLLLVDGRAGLVREESIRRLLKLAAVFPGEEVCSVSFPIVHPYYLKHIRKDGTITAAVDGDASSRQLLPKVVCRDGALYLGQTGKDLQATRGLLIGEAEGRIMRHVVDGVRAMTLDKFTRGKPDHM